VEWWGEGDGRTDDIDAGVRGACPGNGVDGDGGGTVLLTLVVFEIFTIGWCSS